VFANAFTMVHEHSMGLASLRTCLAPDLGVT
jgi:hypothetical protein